MRRKAENGVIILVGLFFVVFAAIACNYYRIAAEQKYVSAAEERSLLKVTAGNSYGTIYDRNMIPLVNGETIRVAVAVPMALNRNDVAEYALDKEKFFEEFDKGMPFVFRCKDNTPESEGLTVFELPQRYSSEQPAQHVIGYISDNKGVAGIEYAYDSILRGDYGESSVTYSVDGFGRVLIGDGKEVVRSNAAESGVVTTIDADIQNICEECGSDIDKGAIVVADISTGDILALASFPSFSTEKLDESLSDERSPLINRALYSYSVGSIFKLVTACEAIEEGYDKFLYKCDGNLNVEGVNFNCHRLDGHGSQDMEEAMTNSCNTYFINLSRSYNTEAFRMLAYNFGFGKENYLCSGMVGSAGVLPTVRELLVPAELANFSFGQGKLTATPLQITQLTCTIANEGRMPVLRIIKGITLDGINTANEKNPQYSTVIEKETADQLKDMMISAISDNKDSNAKSRYVTVGAKTSTAQTGRFENDGNELCHAWITGFFPANNPEYAVTVLVEDGGYGNDAAAPIFREIVDKIYQKT